VRRSKAASCFLSVPLVEERKSVDGRRDEKRIEATREAEEEAEEKRSVGGGCENLGIGLRIGENERERR
jgi:hypothetical protein